jgi:hypothetical protein
MVLCLVILQIEAAIIPIIFIALQCSIITHHGPLLLLLLHGTISPHPLYHGLAFSFPFNPKLYLANDKHGQIYSS